MSTCPRFAIVKALAESLQKQMVRKTIRSLQRPHNEYQLGLEMDSIWDEICVQVQHHEFWAWHIHLKVLEVEIFRLADKLAPHELQAIWLETPEGSDWDCEDEDERQPFFANLSDVIK